MGLFQVLDFAHEWVESQDAIYFIWMGCTDSAVNFDSYFVVYTSTLVIDGDGNGGGVSRN